MMFFTLFLAAATALLLTFSLGYITARAFTQCTVKQCQALAGAYGIGLQATIAFIGFLAGLQGRTFFLLATVGVFTIGILVLRQKRIAIAFTRSHFLLNVLLAAWVALVSTQLFVVIYSGARWYGDWWMHYDVAQVYLGNQSTTITYFGKYSVVSRTPLFNLFCSYYLGIFGNGFAIYQLTAILPQISLLTTVPLLIRPTWVSIAFTLITFNAYMNNNAIYPWPKVLASLYVITGIYFYLYIRETRERVHFREARIACGISWGLAFLSHPSTILYFVAVVCDNIWLNRRLSKILRQLSVSALLIIALSLPWVAWGMLEYGPKNSLLALSNTTDQSISLTERLTNMVGNATSTLLPYYFFEGLSEITHSDNLKLKDKLGILWDPWLRFHYSVLPGALTIIITLLLIWGGICRYFNKQRLQTILPDSLFVAVSAIGFFGGCVLQPGFHRGGIVAESMTPIVFLLLLVGTEYLFKLPVKLRWATLLLVVSEFIASRGLHLILLAMDHPIVHDDNIHLKSAYSLVFARDLIGTPWLAVSVMLFACLILLIVGGRSFTRASAAG